MKKDTVTKDYMSDAAVLADAFNYYIHGGKQVIQPKHLTERDPTEIALPYGTDGAAIPIQKFRDVRKLYAAMTDEEIMKFQSSLREVMLFIKYSKDKNALKELLDRNRERFQCVERRAVDVINVITGTELKYDESEVAVDVCKAILDMRLESEQIGEERGKQIGEKNGERIGEFKKARESAERFYKMGIAVEKVAEGVGYDVSTVKEWLNLPVS